VNQQDEQQPTGMTSPEETKMRIKQSGRMQTNWQDACQLAGKMLASLPVQLETTRLVRIQTR
jgi:hypothetical protein